MAYKEIYNFLESAEKVIESLSKQISNPSVDYTLGTGEETDNGRR